MSNEAFTQLICAIRGDDFDKVQELVEQNKVRIDKFTCYEAVQPNHSIILTYFLKKNNIKSNSSKLEEKLNECKVSPSYNELEEIKDGILYYDGMKIELNTFLESDAIKEVENKEDRYNDNIYIDFEDIDVDEVVKETQSIEKIESEKSGIVEGLKSIQNANKDLTDRMMVLQQDDLEKNLILLQLEILEMF